MPYFLDFEAHELDPLNDSLISLLLASIYTAIRFKVSSCIPPLHIKDSGGSHVGNFRYQQLQKLIIQTHLDYFNRVEFGYLWPPYMAVGSIRIRLFLLAAESI